jgi:L-amino acid N-acyltransferase
MVAGWACLSPFVEKSCFERTAYTSTYVSRDYRGRGIGRALREHVISEARRLGFHSLVNRIFTRNDVSVRLTEQLGFVRVGTLRQVIWKEGDYWDAALYQLLLEPSAGTGHPPVRDYHPAVRSAGAADPGADVSAWPL